VRERVSRGRFGQRAVVAVGVVAFVFAVFATAALARGKPGDPKPIPGGLSLPLFEPVPSDPFIHVLPPVLMFPPAQPFDMSTIGDFDGTLGAADIQGTAHGSDGTLYTFDADMRFMRGVYVDGAGHVQHGSFAFI
jgi:hypothetical protein